MDTGELDCVTISIDKMLQDLSPISSDSCIFKVPNQLRMVNEKAFEPQIISIGPYHRGKQHLLAMEEHKKRYLQQLLQRYENTSVSKYVKAMRTLEQRVRKSYAEPVSLSIDEFVEMMVLDGCFFVELMWKFIDKFNEETLNFQFEHMFARILFDILLLLENQLPFFVLEELFGMNSIVPDQENFFIKSILLVFKWVLPGEGYDLQDVKEMKQIKHLIELLHDNFWQPSPARMKAYFNNTRGEERSYTSCATELKEAGIKFKKVEGSCSLFDIKFKNGVLEISKIEIDDITECLFRNLIAYEQLSNKDTNKYPSIITDYTTFMDSLINSAKDVELLRQKGIIKNSLRDDETIAILFNKLGDNVNCCWKSFYQEIEKDVNKHCSRQRNVWLAKLRHDYFNSPWALISVLAAVLLLFLTLAQTVYSVLSYYK